MRALSNLELLSAWEQGLTQTPIQRTLTVLASASSDMTGDALAQLSIGQRDARLLTLRERTFGQRLVSLTTCQGCGETLELPFDVADIQVPSETEPTEALSITTAGYEVRFRLPNSLDLATVEDAPIDVGRAQLLARCVLAVQRNGQPVSTEELPEEVVSAVEERMVQADPQAEIQLILTCPECDRQWKATFDIASFLWSEIDASARRLLAEVHMLASVYHWPEADILALNSSRRRWYLDMVQG